MISKHELIALLEEAIKKEDSAIPLYSRHISKTLFFSDFSKDDQKQIHEILDRLFKDSERHREIFEHILADVKESTNDVF